MGYYDWHHGLQTCPKCNWSGPGRDASLRESYEAGAEYQCPKCDHYFGFIAYPTTTETITDSRAAPIDRLIAQVIKANAGSNTPVKEKLTADIPVRRFFKDYICTIAYSEADEQFEFVSARNANAAYSQTPEKPFELYLKVLRTPALRARLVEALLPEQKGQVTALREEAILERAQAQGLWLGLAIFALVGYALYELTLLLADHFGYQTAELITYLPMFFAFLVIFPTKEWYTRWSQQRYCEIHGHRLRPLTEGVSLCSRCGFTEHT